MEIVLVRHGESDGNANGLCQGHSPGYLTTNGLSQATSLGSTLFSKGEYDDIYCSDLTRVTQTLQASMATTRSFTDSVIYDSLLREKSAGIFEGKKRELMQNARTRSGLDERLYQPQDGESWQQLQDRVKLFYGKIKEKYNGKSHSRLLVYTSGGWIKEFINFYVYLNQQLYPNVARNAHIYVFRRKADSDEFEMVMENQRTL